MSGSVSLVNEAFTNWKKKKITVLLYTHCFAVFSLL